MSAGVLGCWGAGVVSSPPSIFTLTHSASLRYVRFAGEFRRLRDPSFYDVVWLSCGYRVVGAEPLLGYRAELASLGGATPLASLGDATPLDDLHIETQDYGKNIKRNT